MGGTSVTLASEIGGAPTDCYEIQWPPFLPGATVFVLWCDLLVGRGALEFKIEGNKKGRWVGGSCFANAVPPRCTPRTCPFMITLLKRKLHDKLAVSKGR